MKQLEKIIKCGIENVANTEIQKCRLQGCMADLTTKQGALTAYILYRKADAFEEDGFIITESTIVFTRECEYIAEVCRELQRCRIFLPPHREGKPEQRPEKLHDEFGEACYLYRASNELH